MRLTLEDLLSLFLYAAAPLSQPTLRNYIRSCKPSRGQNDFRSQVRRLHQRRWLVASGPRKGRRYRLASAGRLVALGGIDPEVLWRKAWDGVWQACVFDIPEKRFQARARLLRWLHHHRFGFLQNSLWIRPDWPSAPFPRISGISGAPERLLVLKVQCCGGCTDAQVVQGAWDFPAINNRYGEYLRLCQHDLARLADDSLGLGQAIGLLRAERHAWLEATCGDPFLPEALLPVDYLGRKAWAERQKLLGLKAVLVQADDE